MIITHLSVYALQAGVKAKKATETYKSFVEKYATAKSEFEQKMAETAQVLPLKPVFVASLRGDQHCFVSTGDVCTGESVFHICALYYLQIMFFPL